MTTPDNWDQITLTTSKPAPVTISVVWLAILVSLSACALGMLAGFAYYWIT